ncbi:MAG: hypothetical protein JWR89_2388 [Tardiphaga sp.]|uniref:DUF3280 domain-containing protein n=1 Tax=Tardiphaga sp. TaxID=1926292 RepID=UPI00261BD76D|nr:DUF3280 domain-containing protein [Tardiphaga sp.]MDB5502486.1 hypothetical protein [Tardiphaga sp.]
MREIGFVVLAVLAGSVAARADGPRAAVFDFELIDTSLQGEKDGQRADEQARLLRAGDQLRKGLEESGKYVLVDIAPVRVEAHNSNLQACGGCDVQFAQQLGADLAITGTVQKVSNLILNMNVYIRNARTGHLVTAMSADFRSNTDESWSRTVSYLLRNRLLAPNYGAPQ